MTYPAEYHVWRAMKRRCTNDASEGFSNYGGKGIMYCAQWERFDLFFKQMGECPKGLSLERLKNGEGYNKENCIWATRSQQNFNRGTLSTNTSGIKGVSWIRARCCAQGSFKKVKYDLYWGNDFFEAICRRKSWENAVRNGAYK